MDHQEATERLAELRHIEQALVKTLDETLPRIEDPDLADRLREFRGVHAQHVQRIDDAFVAYGGGPPEIANGFKRFVETLVDRIAHSRRQEELLGGILGAERACADEYADASRVGALKPRLDLLQRQGQECRDQVDYLERYLPAVFAVYGR